MESTFTGIDHSVTIVTEYEATWSLYEKLGFTLSPPSRHQVSASPDKPLVRNCTTNRCAYFGNSYIELIGIVDQESADPWNVRPLVADGYAGLRGVSFGVGNTEKEWARLRTLGLAGSGVLSLERPVDTPDGPRTVKARTVHFDRARTPEGIVHTSEHLTPQYVHQTRFLGHANGARRLESVLLVVADEELTAVGERYAAILGRPAETDGPRLVFRFPAARMEIVPASALDTVLPGETAPQLPYFAAHTVLVDDLAAARSLIEDQGVATRDLPDGFFVGASDSHGASVVFKES